MAPEADEELVDAATIGTILNLPCQDLIPIWIRQDIGFPEPLTTDAGLMWTCRDVLLWARQWGWPV